MRPPTYRIGIDTVVYTLRPGVGKLPPFRVRADALVPPGANRIGDLAASPLLGVQILEAAVHLGAGIDLIANVPLVEVLEDRVACRGVLSSHGPGFLSTSPARELLIGLRGGGMHFRHRAARVSRVKPGDRR